MRSLGVLAGILCIVVSLTLLGCLMGEEKSMNVTLNIEFNDCIFEAEEVEEGLQANMKVVVRAENVGDPGYVTFKVEVKNDEGGLVADKTERVHLDTGQTKIIDVTMQKIVPPDADVEVYYPELEELKRELD